MKRRGYIKQLLKTYEQALEQQVNFGKSAIMFSPNMCNMVRRDIMNTLDIVKIMDSEKYLGMLLFFRRSKKLVLRDIQARISAKVKGCQGGLLPPTGKAVLIPSVAHAIPLYQMSYFQFPKTFLYDLNMLIARFWWGGG